MRLTQRELAGRLGVTPPALSQATSRGHRCSGHPVHRWAVRRGGQVIYYEVPTEVATEWEEDGQKEEIQEQKIQGEDSQRQDGQREDSQEADRQPGRGEATGERDVRKALEEVLRRHKWGDREETSGTDRQTTDRQTTDRQTDRRDTE